MATSLLSCKNMVSDYGTIGDYLIEWRLDSRSGTTVFYSGVGTDPLIQATHPFSGESVISGTLYPVLKYAYFDGVKYQLDYAIGNYSPDLLHCLTPEKIVDGYNCSNGIAGTYSHTITYVNNIDPSINAERKIKFDLNADGTTNYIAWRFDGFTVSDRITLWYYHINDIENPTKISDWIVGLDLTGDNYGQIPRKFDFTDLEIVDYLTDQNYQIGDYLIFHIIPRVTQPSNLNTNWTLKMKCLSTFIDNDVQNEMRILDPTTVNIVYDTTNCLYRVKFKTLVPYVFPAHYRSYLNQRFLTDEGSDSSQYGTYYKLATQELCAALRNTSSISRSSINGTFTCVDLVGTINVNKSGNTLTYTFTDNDQYLIYKNSYTGITTNANWTNYSADPNNPYHWKHFGGDIRVANSCGDSFSTVNISFSRTAPFVFDDGLMTITITLELIVNDATNIPCNALYGEAANIVTYVNQTYNSGNWNYLTHVRAYAGFIGKFTNAFITTVDNSILMAIGYGVVNDTMIEFPKPTGWKNLFLGGEYGFFMAYGYVTFTNVNDKLNNFTISTNFDNQGYALPTTIGNVVFEKQNGNIIIPSNSATTYITSSSIQPTIVVSSGSWNNFIIENINTDNDGLYAYTQSTTHVTGVTRGFNINVPTGATILGIGVITRIAISATSATAYSKVRISKNAGSSWSTYKTEQTNPNVAYNNLGFGGSKDLWGLTLTPTEVNDINNFYVEINGRISNASKQCRLDSVRLVVYYELTKV